jgi:FecR protein
MIMQEHLQMANARAIFCRAASTAGCVAGYAAIIAASCAPGAWAQSVISAHSGVIHYVEGDVSVDSTPVHPKFAEFPDVKAGQLVATTEGRAEILLTPGVFLRMAENSSVRMLSNALADTRLEVVSGAALVEVGELLEHNAITFVASGVQMELAKKGLFRIDASPASLRVYEGQARVASGSENLTARKGHQIDLDSAKLADTKFETKDTDAFYRWSSRRAEYVAAANVISARVTSNSDYGSSFTSNPGAWSWNPYFGMFTFLPASGVYWSPFGSPFYSPGMAWAAYVPRRSSPVATPGLSTPVGLSASPASFNRSGGIPGGTLGGGGMHGSGPALPGARSSATRGR